MAKVRGPLFSIEAFGTFAGVLVYQRRRATATVYPWGAPRNPDTPAQQEQRASFAAAISAWGALPDASKAWWTVKAWGLRLSGYHMFVQNYLLGLLEG